LGRTPRFARRGGNGRYRCGSSRSSRDWRRSAIHPLETLGVGSGNDRIEGASCHRHQWNRAAAEGRGRVRTTLTVSTQWFERRLSENSREPPSARRYGEIPGRDCTPRKFSAAPICSTGRCACGAAFSGRQEWAFNLAHCISVVSRLPIISRSSRPCSRARCSAGGRCGRDEP